MAKANNPFANYDFSKMWGEFRVPAVDVESLMAAQQRNVDALSSASKLAVEGLQQVAQRQAELLRDAFEQSSEAAQQYARLSTAEERLAQQAKYAKAAFKTGLDNAREISGMVTRTATEAAEIVNNRIIEGLDEMEGLVVKTNGPSPAKPAPKTTAK